MRTDTSPEALALVGDARRREAIQAGAPLPELLAFTQLPVSLVEDDPGATDPEIRSAAWQASKVRTLLKDGLGVAAGAVTFELAEQAVEAVRQQLTAVRVARPPAGIARCRSPTSIALWPGKRSRTRSIGLSAAKWRSSPGLHPGSGKPVWPPY